ncbi:MAG: hypothetical protein JXB07_20450 [Anaerolineae bacterium]|nr:hypothetical protein [Anaerolineae bacterium]
MSTSILSVRIFAYLVVEAVVLLFSLGLVSRLVNREQLQWEEHVVSSLYLAFAVKSTLALVLTYLKLNNLFSYLAISIMMLFLLYRGYPVFLQDISQRLISPLTRRGRTEIILIGIAAIFFSPILASSIRPIQETDSLFFFNAMFDWLKGNDMPYSSHLFGYPAYWELTFLPAMSVVGSDQMLWLNPLLAVAGIMLAQFALARQVGLETKVAFLLAVAGIALKVYWVDNSGIATVKNDMLQAGGLLLLTLGGVRAVQDRLTPATGLMVALGLISASAKYGGMITGVAGLGLMMLFTLPALWQARTSVLLWGLLTGVSFLSTTGGYYLRNAVMHGNPLYPMQLDLPGNISLPGSLLLQGTAITDNLADPNLWRTLSNEFYVGGIVLPLSIVVSLTLIVGMIIIALADKVLKRPPIFSRGIVFLVTYTVLGLALYARSFWSAGTAYGNYSFLIQIGSLLRYASAWVLLGEVLLFFIIARARLDSHVQVVLLGLIIGSRLQHLYAHEIHAAANAPYYSLGPLATCCALLVLLAIVRNRAAIQIGLVTTGLIGMLIVSPLVFEHNRAFWLPAWAPAQQYFLDADEAHIAVFHNGSTEEGWPSKIAVTGRNFQHHVTLLRDRDLPESQAASVDYVVRLANPFTPPKHNASERDAAFLQEQGYTIEVMTDYVIIAVPEDQTGE